MAYLAVDKDGRELIFETKPMRRRNLNGGKIKAAVWGMCSGFYTKNNWNRWCNGWSTDVNDFLPQNGIVLPKNTISNIIGYQLKWKDDPVKL